MKLVYTNENNMLVNSAKNMLMHNGLSVYVVNEHNSTGGHVLLANMELWVNHDADYPTAMKLLSALENPDMAPDWTCAKCNETNDASFEICWNCGHDAESQA